MPAREVSVILEESSIPAGDSVEGKIELGHGTLLVTCKQTFDGAATDGVIVEMYTSPDDTDYDTDILTSFEPAFSAGNTAQKSRPVNSTAKYFLVRVKNKDGVNAQGVCKVTLTRVFTGNVADELVKRLSTAYTKESTSNNYKLLLLPGEQLYDIDLVQSDIKDAHWIDYATGKSHENLGEFFGVRRKTDELDKDYRQRIKSTWQAYSGDGTESAIKNALNLLLDIPLSDIVIAENLPAEPAHFDIQFPTLWSTKQTEIEEIVDLVKLGGVSYDLVWVGGKWDTTLKWDTQGKWGS